MDFMGTNELFCGNNPRLIEHKIIEFINILREKGRIDSACTKMRIFKGN